MIVFTFDEEGPHLIGEGPAAADRTLREALGEPGEPGPDERDTDMTVWQKVCR